MSIGSQVAETIRKMDASDFEGALFAICAAIDATATKESGKPQSDRTIYKGFIHANLGLITDIAFGGRKILNMNLRYDHPKIRKDANGLSSIQDVFYHAVRCGLYHDAALPHGLKFTDEQQFRVDRGALVLPSSLIYGLIVAVVISPVNKGEASPDRTVLNLRSFPIPLSKLWGRRAEFLWLLETLAEAIRLQDDARQKDMDGQPDALLASPKATPDKSG